MIIQVENKLNNQPQSANQVFVFDKNLFLKSLLKVTSNFAITNNKKLKNFVLRDLS